MCDAIGHPVDRLRRVAIGPIHDNRLKPGQWRELTADEVARLRGAPGAGTGDRRPATGSDSRRHAPRGRRSARR
jgi:hypothetical protein